MAFQNHASIQTIVCPSCRGSGCVECERFGVYAISRDRTLVFSPPSFLALEKRKKAKLLFLVKKTILMAAFIIVVFYAWGVINKI
jgi:hypothetical protein